MSSSTERSLIMHLWWIGLQPPYGGVVPWGRFSKSPQWYPRDLSWGVLPFPLFSDREEADSAFAENGFDKEEYRVVRVKVTIAEVSEGEAKEEIEAGVR